jgi:hypothetical protein
MGAASPLCSINLKCANVLNTGQPDRGLELEQKLLVSLRKKKQLLNNPLINTFASTEG